MEKNSAAERKLRGPQVPDRMTNGLGGDAKYAFWFRDHSQLAFATLRLTCLPPHQS